MKERLEAAHEMIERFGPDTLSQIDQRIAELEELGEMDAVRFWRDVQATVAVILQAGESRSIQ
ncbi:MAG: hypothetical protein KDK75_15555 [Alphaproteobacteria bacterium]|nr:hypothetical protein [Alphaproteobacteria bacterium]